MKTILMTGEAIKSDNGSGYRLANRYPLRRFHDKTVYRVLYQGVDVDCSTVVAITRSRKGWEAAN